MEPSGALVQHIEKGNGVFSPPCSLSSSVVGDICMSEVLEQPGDLALPVRKCNEESRCAGSFKSASGGTSDKQVNSKVDLATDDLKIEKPVRKKKKNKKKIYSAKGISNKIFSETGHVKDNVSNAKPSSSSFKEELDSPAMNCEKSLENNTPLVSSTSLCEIHVKQCPGNLNIHNYITRTCCKSSKKNKRECEDVSSNSLTEDGQESPFGHLSQCKSGESMDIMPCEVCNGTLAIRESNEFKCPDLASELDAVDKTKHWPCILTGKKNSLLVWQKRQNARETQTSEAKRSQCNYVHKDVCMQQKNLFAKSNSFLRKRSLPTSLIASSGNRKRTVFTDGASYCSSSASAAQGQPTMSCSTKFTLPVQFWFKPYSGKLLRMDHELTRSFCASANSESYMRFKQFNDLRFGKYVNSGINAKKWVPGCTKGGSSIPQKIGSATICHVRSGDLPLIGGHKINTVETEGPNSGSQSATTEFQCVESTEVRKKDAQNLKDIQRLIIGLQVVTDPLNATYKMQLVSESFEIVMGYPLAEFERFLHSAAPAIASSSLHKECDVCLHDQQSTSSLCKHQTPNISLFTLWKWYEEPGNYGLKVKAGDSENLKGQLSESTSFHAHFVPFLSAVQLFGYSDLSNSCETSADRCKPNMHARNSSRAMERKHLLAKDSVVKFGSIEEPVNSSMVFCSVGPSQSFNHSNVCPNNCELLFEFFETEKPWLRKPLHIKIVDLIDAETSNLQVFGNPSKLISLKLHELHPASWFSVAWYPIYRIPCGKFHAAFLTYHSLGYLVQRDAPIDSLNKKTSYLVSPVVGLQSYKAQGECWFDLKIPVQSSIKEPAFSNCSDIVRKQLEILEQNASLFSEGYVWTDGIKVSNRHQDYNFFSSWKD